MFLNEDKMKKIIESLFYLFYPEPEDITESEKTPFGQKVMILIIIGGICLI